LAWLGKASEPCTCVLAGPEALHPNLAWMLQRVLDHGRTEYLAKVHSDVAPGNHEVTGPLLKVFAAAPAAAERGPDMELRSIVVTPLKARGRVIGALSLAMGPSGRHYNESDRALAEDLASRAAIAIDNARLYSEVQEANRHKNEFLSMLAHELRNPLAPIRNAVQLLRTRFGLQPEIDSIHAIIDRQVQQLARLVDDLLDISRISGGKIRLQNEPVEMADIVARAVETNQHLVDARRHHLTVTLPPQPVRVEGDPVRLAQVLGNLLNNAAKYTPDGGKIWLTVASEGEEAVVRVRDTGIGIPAEMLGSVFDLFTQVDRSLDRSQGGLGIGLNLVRRLVEKHGGRVQAASAGVGQGSEFTMRLPMLAAKPAPAAPLNGAEHKAAPPQRRILVVDDNRDAANSLALLLSTMGHQVQASNDGPGALAILEQFQPEVVLLDIGLPGMDGYEVAKRIREMPNMGTAKLIALTGYGQAEDQRRSKEAGFDHHIVKPADLMALKELCATVGNQDGTLNSLGH
jgi:signal transduction histidine kinase/CheY-like chemotaxis protein